MEHIVKLNNNYLKLKKYIEVFIINNSKLGKDDELS